MQESLDNSDVDLGSTEEDLEEDTHAPLSKKCHLIKKVFKKIGEGSFSPTPLTSQITHSHALLAEGKEKEKKVVGPKEWLCVQRYLSIITRYLF